MYTYGEADDAPQAGTGDDMRICSRAQSQYAARAYARASQRVSTQQEAAFRCGVRRRQVARGALYDKISQAPRGRVIKASATFSFIVRRPSPRRHAQVRQERVRAYRQCKIAKVPRKELLRVQGTRGTKMICHSRCSAPQVPYEV